MSDTRPVTEGGSVPPEGTPFRRIRMDDDLWERLDIAAKKADKYDDAGKPIIEDGTVVTACQQVCPTKAIVFGDISDTSSEVRKLKEEPLNYILLEEVQARPRTSYLWRLTNPNPELV